MLNTQSSILSCASAIHTEKLDVLPEFEHLNYMVATVMCPVSPKIHMSRDHIKFIAIASSSDSG